MKLGILTISDSVPIGKRVDQSGPKIEEILGKYVTEIFYRVCTDEPLEIMQHAKDLLGQVDILISNGGTGIMPRDNTVDALGQIPGVRIAPLERAISYAMALTCGPLSGLATPVVLLCENKYLIALPGKTDEVEAALKEVIKPFFLHHLLFAKIDLKQTAEEFRTNEDLHAK